MQSVHRVAPSNAENLNFSEEIGPSSCQRFKILVVDWRSRELRQLLRLLDLLYVHTKFEEGRAEKGNWVRARYVSNAPGKSKPVAGLLVNCYDIAWLDTQTAGLKKALGVKSAIDLTIPEPLKQYSSCYSLA